MVSWSRARTCRPRTRPARPCSACPRLRRGGAAPGARCGAGLAGGRDDRGPSAIVQGLRPAAARQGQGQQDHRHPRRTRGQPRGIPHRPGCSASRGDVGPAGRKAYPAQGRRPGTHKGARAGEATSCRAVSSASTACWWIFRHRIEMSRYRSPIFPPSAKRWRRPLPRPLSGKSLGSAWLAGFRAVSWRVGRTPLRSAVFRYGPGVASLNAPRRWAGLSESIRRPSSTSWTSVPLRYRKGRRCGRAPLGRYNWPTISSAM